MSENPGPPATGGAAPDAHQPDAPVDTGPGPDEADVNQEPSPDDTHD